MQGMIIGIAAACYVAAFMVTAAALRVPIPQPAETRSQAAPGAPEARAVPPTTPSPVAADAADTAPPAPAPPRVAENTPEEDALLQLAEKSRKDGDIKSAAAIYSVLLRNDSYRAEVTQRLGELYFSNGDYRRAEELFRESASLLREEIKSEPKASVP